MKPYGVRVIEHPDVADIKAMGAKSRTGKLSEHTYCRGPSKSRIRRLWKRVARRSGQNEIKEAL